MEYTERMKAIWNGKVIAESEETVQLEGNQYFPPDSVNKKYLTPSDEKYTCPWKGKAKYWNISVGGKFVDGGAWSYPEPKEAANRIKGYIAFWRGIEVVES